MDRDTEFEGKLKKLLAEARKKKNILESQEVLDFFKEDNLDGGKMDKVYDFLENNGVDVLPNSISSSPEKYEAFSALPVLQ